MSGTLYGIGVGPGDPELLTVKAFRRLKEAHVIAYPKNSAAAKAMLSKLLKHIFLRRKKKCLVSSFQ